MTLESLTLSNFQRHKKLHIEFDPQITSIVGTTDAGKSAILRALRWVCLNQPNGVEFRRHGSKHVGVGLEVDGYRIVRKRRGTNSNQYAIRPLNEEEGDVFAAFGRSVPPDIATVLNVSEDNFQGQHDPAFWLTLSASQVPKEINRIIDLDEIDRSLKWLRDKLRRSKTEAELQQVRVREAKAVKRKLAWVKACDRDLCEVEAAKDLYRRKRTRRKRLEVIVQRVEDATLEAGRALQNVTGVRDALKTSSATYDNLRTTRKRVSALTKLINQAQAKQEESWSLAQRVQELKAALPEGCPVCGR